MRPRTSTQSLSSYIYEHLDELEHLISVGVYHDAICAQLGHGSSIPSVATFKKSLARARRKRMLSSAPFDSAPPVRAKKAGDMAQISGGRLSAKELELLEKRAASAA